MPQSIITLTTDFGAGSPYVAQMKGVLLTLNPAATIVDITHNVPPQDVRQGARVLDEVARWFPAGTIHVVVVDPGVGTDRRIVCALIDERYYIAPDNGLLTLVARKRRPTRIAAVTNPAHWLKNVSNTFHGRDIMAPVAASLSLGVELSEFGASILDLVELDWPEVDVGEHRVRGSVVSFDSFGNLITDITADSLTELGEPSQLRVQCGPHVVNGVVATYAERPRKSLAALIGSSGFLELAIVNGHAAKTLGVRVGDEVIVRG
ncbi:MAG: SAM-dependent chlorinase/fluorinase [Pirellulaceae bacterium]